MLLFITKCLIYNSDTSLSELLFKQQRVKKKSPQPLICDDLHNDYKFVYL